MGIIVSLLIGALMGWIASIVMRTDTQRGILLDIGTGIIGALFASIAISGFTALIDISLRGSLMALFGSVILLGIVGLTRRIRAR